MIRALIGHRGSGKTSLLKRISSYFEQRRKPVRCIDLDELIAQQEQTSISEIFAQKGEAYFRRVEQEVFTEVYSELKAAKTPTYIALGAGFEGSLPEDLEVIWVRRISDKGGRIFMDRPLLNPNLTPMADYLARVHSRELRYKALSQIVLTLPEGFSDLNTWEPIWLGLDVGQIGGYLTVLPEVLAKLRSKKSLGQFFETRRGWGVNGFELRDDLLTGEQIELLKGLLAPEEILFSLRKAHQPPDWVQSDLWDWPLERGNPPPNLGPSILSLHERGASFSATLERLPRTKSAHIKFAPEIFSFSELLEGHYWWTADKDNRSFLPCSHDGRWRWYRQLFGPQMKIGFWREGDGPHLDQPFVADWIRTYTTFSYFAAILGYPVEHSFTPAEQGDFFGERQMPVVAISMQENEMTPENMQTLMTLGLRAAAVTSPLKIKAFELCRERSHEAVAMRSVNTLVWDALVGGFKGHNSDLMGLEELFRDVRQKNFSIAVWGSGGTKESIRALLPEAHFCSVRNLALENGEPLSSISPEIVVWALGRSRWSPQAMPPEGWKPMIVLDLNYTLDSPGREYAKVCGAQYSSGYNMFRIQAAGQRVFWQEHLRLL